MENFLNKNHETITLVYFEDKWIYDIKWKKINIPSIFTLSFPWRWYIELIAHIIYTIKYIKIENPDIVIWIWTYCNLLWLIAKKIYNFKLLLTQHEHITSRKINTPKLLVYNLIYFITKKIIWDNKIICVSNEVRWDTIKCFKLKEKQAQTIYNWLDFDLIESKWNESISIKDKYLINIGSLDDRKNQEMLIKAYAKSKCKNEYYLLLLWEWVKKEYLMNLVKDLWIEKSVIFAGFDKNPYKYLKNASMFCFTSLSEALPTVLIESLILKVPVLTVPVIWSKEILDDWNCWIITENWDIDKYSKLMDEIIARDNSNMVNKWFLFAKENFEIKAMEKKYLETINNL